MTLDTCVLPHLWFSTLGSSTFAAALVLHTGFLNLCSCPSIGGSSAPSYSSMPPRYVRFGGMRARKDI